MNILSKKCEKKSSWLYVTIDHTPFHHHQSHVMPVNNEEFLYSRTERSNRMYVVGNR